MTSAAKPMARSEARRPKIGTTGFARLAGAYRRPLLVPPAPPSSGGTPSFSRANETLPGEG